MDTPSVSEQERLSPEAASRSESAMFPLDNPESEDVWSPVLFGLPVTASSSGSVGFLMGLEEGLEDSCLYHPELVLISGVVRCMVISLCGAVLSPNLNSGGGDAGPLSGMRAK